MREQLSLDRGEPIGMKRDQNMVCLSLWILRELLLFVFTFAQAIL